MSDPQQLYPCPVCHRKFVKKSLEVHLRSCDKKGKYHSTNSGYDNKAFLDRLDKAMEAEGKQSGYQPSKKKPGAAEQNKAFLDRLDKAMEAEEKQSGYKPYVKKEVKNPTDQEIFEQNLNKALEQEGNNPSGQNKPAPKKKQPTAAEQNKAFMDKLDKAMEAEEKNPTYKPSTHGQNKKVVSNNNTNDWEAKLNEAMKNEEANSGYHPSGKTVQSVEANKAKKKATQARGAYDKNEYLKNLEKAMDQEKEKPQGNNQGQDSRKFPKMGGRGGYDQQAFLDNLDKAMAAEEKSSGYKPSSKKATKEEMDKKFLERVQAEMEKDKENPYVSYEERRKKENRPQEQDSNKLFMERLEKEMEKEKQ